ncbi:hypothetical protein SODALDRAFT_319481 [Sodiomyces alkalinus F11]|uniref:Sister chromatid cohesion protein DCC1 n=1 Tax=Sodiomyces alkalinus (strain CBS 110278 / VKM F-3762 / F11) TaxID=1314773 RepID=A0A3N2Q8C1_SODAK|nr:hypothetical protein SODALDRAFT_319481 [Sodiomyces alkalinus F11]ROT42908.1 hypothetical protein SODALDRAFT_319481 [Sodiomyces alkalinus F11]
MSSQDNAGIRLDFAPDGRNYRLFELPPELESLLQSPTAPVLYLKQPENESSAVLTNVQGKTYTLQQKNTSNSLLLLTPSSTTSHPSQPGESTQTTHHGLTAVAALHETIELVTQAPTAEQKARGKWHERFGRNR